MRNLIATVNLLAKGQLKNNFHDFTMATDRTGGNRENGEGNSVASADSVCFFEGAPDPWLPQVSMDGEVNFAAVAGHRQEHR